MRLLADGEDPSWPECIELARRANPHYSMSEREQELLFDLAVALPQGSLIVELGVCHGKTAMILAYCSLATRSMYMGVDNWSLEGTRDEVQSLLFESGLAWNTNLVQGSTHEVPLPELPIDLLLIDAGHDFANVSVDVSRWVPLVKPGGLVVFDDYPGEHNWRDSPHWAVRECADAATRDWDLVAFWGKMLARRRPNG